jgi:AcrR family transcriptional regulator
LRTTPSSKEGLVRELLVRARGEQLALVRASLENTEIRDVGDVVEVVWRALAAPERRRLVRLIYEAFIMSLQPDPGPWQGFAAEQVTDWLALLRAAQPDTAPGQAEARATCALAVVRGLLLDLLATGDNDRIADALAQQRV